MDAVTSSVRFSVAPSVHRLRNLSAIRNCLGFTDLIQVLTGNAYCEGGDVIPMFREYSEGRIPEEKLRVHLYLWFNEWKPGRPQTAQPAKGGKRGGIEGSIHKRFPGTRRGWFTFRAVSQENYLAWATM
jgi:hypothetical protein